MTIQNILVSTAALVAAVVSATPAAGDGLVVNGGFNQCKNGRTVGWNEVAPRYVFRDGEGRSGTRALCYNNDDPKFYTFPGQSIQLKPGKVYEFEVWARTENLKGSGSGATICIEWTRNGKWMGGEYAHGVRGTKDWTRVSGVTPRIPEGATGFVVHPYVRKGMTGKAWFDDLAVREYVPKPVEALYSTAYRNVAADGDVTFKAALNLDKDALAGQAIWFRFTDAAGKPCRVQADTFTHETATLKRSVASLAKGAQTVTAELCRADGTRVGQSELTFTRVDTLPKRSVWIDRLGRTIVDGRPFFPLGMYWSGINTNKLEFFAKSAFNCIMPYGAPNSKAALDFCHSRGIKVIYSVKDAYFGSHWCPSSIRSEADEVTYVTDRVTRFKDHPAVLAWYLNDEMPLTMLPRLVARRDLLEKLDPDHPTWVVLYQYSQIRDYMQSFDVIGTDPYPIPTRPALMATTWTRATAAATMGCKPLWQVPQAFDWGVGKKDPVERAKFRPPTETELRSMSWQCIANGANGLVLYSFFDLQKPTVNVPFEVRWAECCRVAEEIRRFFPVFLSDEKADTPPVQGLCDAETVGETVSVRSWWKDGEAWVLIVNGGDKPVTASVKLNGAFEKASAAFGTAGALKGTDTLTVSLAPLQQSFMRLTPVTEREFVFYNIAPFSPGREKKLAADLRDYAARTGNRVVLYSMTLHPQGTPATRKADFQIDSYRKLKKELEGSDVQLGVLLQSLIGHWPRVDADEEPWTRTVNCDGQAVRYCVLDPNYRKYVQYIVRQFAREKPAFVMSDDDVRWFSPKAECFCALHTAAFNRRTSQNLTSDEYRRRVRESKVGDPVYEAYVRLQRDSIDGLARLVRETLDSVDPSIPAGACMPGWDLRFCGETARAIAGKTPAILRVANAMYSEWSAKDLPKNVLRTQAMKQYHGALARVLDESDTFPHNLFSRSSKGLHAKLCTSILAGLRGAKIWYVNVDKRDARVSENYTDVLAENKGLYQTLAREVRESEPAGVIVPLQRDLPAWHPMRPHGHFFASLGNWADIQCGAFGIPFYGSFDRTREGVYLLSGAKNVDRFTDAELRELLSGKLLIDGAAAVALAKRGFEKHIGVKPELKPFKYTVEGTPKGDQIYYVDKSPSVPFLTVTGKGAEVLTQFFYEQWTYKGLDTAVAPATVLYRNALGGCVVTTANCVENRTYTLSPSRKKWLLDILDRLSGSQLPYTVVGSQNILALAVKKPAGETVLGVFNLNFDTMKTLSVRCAKIPSEVQQLGGDGVWRRVAFTHANGVVTLPIPLTCYDCAFLKFK